MALEKGTRLSDDWARNLLAPTINMGVVNPMVVKQQGGGPLYLVEGDVAVPFGTDYQTYLAYFGSAKVIELSPAEFAKLKVTNLKIVKQ